MKKIIKKLAINKETVRRLAGAELAILQGGRPKLTRLSECEDCTGDTVGCDTSRLVICGCLQ